MDRRQCETWFISISQGMAWYPARETAKKIWHKTTVRDWPDMTIGLIRGVAVLAFEIDYNKDSERLPILISMTIWAI